MTTLSHETLKDQRFVHRMPATAINMPYSQLHASLQGMHVMPVLPHTRWKDDGHAQVMIPLNIRPYSRLAVDNTFVAGGYIVVGTDTYHLEKDLT